MGINNPEYWERRFSSGDWEAASGRLQTSALAEGQVRRLALDPGFSGTILDFGCGLGDAVPVYARTFPEAKLIGLDIAPSAIEMCRESYGHLAEFRVGSAEHAPKADVIIASNVLEHLPDDRGVARTLLEKCGILYVVVPYLEHPRHVEHVRSYDCRSFADLRPARITVFPCRGWSEYGLRDRCYNIHLKNVVRRMTGRPVRSRSMQVMYRFHSGRTPSG